MGGSTIFGCGCGDCGGGSMFIALLRLLLAHRTFVENCGIEGFVVVVIIVIFICENEPLFSSYLLLPTAHVANAEG